MATNGRGWWLRRAARLAAPRAEQVVGPPWAVTVQLLLGLSPEDQAGCRWTGAGLMPSAHPTRISASAVDALRQRPVCPPVVERVTALQRFQPGGLVLQPGARRQGSVASLWLAAQKPQRRQSLGALLLAAGGLAAVSRRAPRTANGQCLLPRLGLALVGLLLEDQAGCRWTGAGLMPSA